MSPLPGRRGSDLGSVASSPGEMIPSEEPRNGMRTRVSKCWHGRLARSLDGRAKTHKLKRGEKWGHSCLTFDKARCGELICRIKIVMTQVIHAQ